PGSTSFSSAPQHLLALVLGKAGTIGGGFAIKRADALPLALVLPGSWLDEHQQRAAAADRARPLLSPL
ncbi:MAG: hypothetical protein ACRETS_03515, partial [Steroidobacteraceae bacterium]